MVDKIEEKRGLPGGIPAPALVFAAFFTLFLVAIKDPDLIDLGPHFSAAGIGVLGMVAGFFWFLVAIGLHKKKD